MNKIQRIGVLTSGGDCPGLNAVIRAVVKTAINDYGWEVTGIEDGFEGLIKPGKAYPLAFSDVRGILPRGGTILGTTNRANPFEYIVNTTFPDGTTEPLAVDKSDDVIRNAKALGLDVLVVIGGDGSLRIAYELMQKGLAVVGVPKTIDNDLLETSVTFGFDTAINTAMEALDRLHTTAESHHRVIVLEVMGRDTGWIALEAGIAGGADVILIPEIPFDLEEIAKKIRSRDERGAKFSIVVAAEGAYPKGGQPTYREKRQLGQMRRLGGVGAIVAEQLESAYDVEARVTVLGHLQRGGSPTAADRLLGSRFGNSAVHLIAENKLGHMVALQDDRIVAVPLREAVVGQKFVPLDSDLVRTAYGLDLCLGDSHANIQKLRTMNRIQDKP